MSNAPQQSPGRFSGLTLHAWAHLRFDGTVMTVVASNGFSSLTRTGVGVIAWATNTANPNGAHWVLDQRLVTAGWDGGIVGTSVFAPTSANAGNLTIGSGTTPADLPDVYFALYY
jgi:hypothetical protein